MVAPTAPIPIAGSGGARDFVVVAIHDRAAENEGDMID
jgi:hypothetical protein